jgi:outer membrane receptor for ferric coprogen and ferric-rhodotorulic acid
MTNKIPSRYVLALLSVLTLGSGSAWAQTAPSATPADSGAASDEETIVLSPFVVDASEDAGSYQATATLAGSRVRTDLRDVGSAISVVTEQFLRDTGATNNQTLLQYTTSTEVSGIGGNFAGLGNGKTLDDTAQRLAPNENTRVRGLSAADNTRDFFLTDIPWDSFNVGRVDLQRGPNAILFGIGKPAGIINSSINGANFKEGGSFEGRFGSYGSLRGTLDYNKVLLPDELSLRISALDDNTKYRQKPAYNHDQRIFGSLRFDPKLLRINGARTSFHMNYEAGEIKANRPRLLPPGDLITPWWTDPSLAAIRNAGGMNPLTLGVSDGPTIAALRAAGDLGAGVRGTDADYYNQKIGSFGRNYGGIVAVYAEPTTPYSALITTDVPKNVTSILTMPWTTMSGVIARKDLEGVLQNKPNYDFYHDETLQDPSIFDFYNKLLDGPNKREWSRHDAFNAALSQTFFDNRLGIEAAVDVQHVRRGQVNLLSEFGQAITLDMNNHLVDGSVNPNYGKAASISDQYANYSYESTRKAGRLTGYGELRAEDVLGKNILSRILGKHVFNAMISKEDFSTENRSWMRYAADMGYGLDVLADPLLRDRGVNTLNYLSGNIADLSSISGANIGNIQVVQVPHSGALKSFDMTWSPSDITLKQDDPWTNPYGVVETQGKNPANYRGWSGAARNINLISDEEGARDLLTTNAGLTRSITTSSAVNWQGYFWDGVFVPSVGVRVDRQKAYALQQDALPFRSDGSATVDLLSPDYRLPDAPLNDVKGRSNSWSFVLHTPKFIREKMWGNTDLTLFYNRSQNFQPAAGRIDVYGNTLPSPRGRTKDYGFSISTLDDRLTFKVTRYQTMVTDDKLDSFGGAYMIWGAEAWAYSFARGNLDRANVGGWADFREGYLPLAGQTVEEAQAIGDAITTAYMNTRLPDAWYKLWAIDLAAAGNFISGTEPSGFTITGDTISKGTEFEISGQPTKNWNITANASKTEAQRLNMAESLIDWVESRWAVYNTPVMLNGEQVGVIGDVRFWNGNYDANESLRGKFGREFMSGYYLYRIQEGSDVPELRPWRFNLVTNYNFSSGVLKGINVGGGYRWQDGVVLGYPVLPGATVTDARAYDLEHPYKGKSETNIDLWLGYSRRLTSKIDWRIQLNLRNITSKKELIPVTVQPDGSMAVGRIAEPFTWTVTNTFKF